MQVDILELSLPFPLVNDITHQFHHLCRGFGRSEPAGRAGQL